MRVPLSSGPLAQKTRPGPMVASTAAHAAVLSFMLLAPKLTVTEQTLYERVISPHRHQLVWYSFRKKLPPISPTEKPDEPFRGAEFRSASQTILSNPKRGERGTQRIQHPSPQTGQQPQLASPSLLAFRLPLIMPPADSSSPPPKPESKMPDAKSKRKIFVPPVAGVGDLDGGRVPIPMEAPTADLAGLPSPDVAIAIVGLNPAAKLNGPLPEAALEARFSAGPIPGDGKGSLDALSSPSLLLPSLLVRDSTSRQTAVANLVALARAAPTSREALAAAARASATQDTQAASEIHMVPPPDPSFDGREVYSFAVQMPNIVSYSGSWLMWFAEREPLGPRQELQPPVPRHKVDPKYLQSAISDGVEGNVVLSGVLQTNGRVREIRILKGVDPRLDLNAARALFKWEFAAAQRNGIPVEMDMIAVIPFLRGTHAAR